MQAGKIFLLVAILSAAPAYAKEKAKIEIRVEETMEGRLDGTAQADVIIPSRVKTPVRTVPELLEKSAGVVLKRYGGLDDFAAISIRGSTTDQVLIYLDGVLLNTARGGIPDLSKIPLSQIERIEVYRGGSPGMLPDSTPGGVIYIHTKRKSDKTQNRWQSSVGSFWTLRQAFEREQTVGPIHYDAAFAYSRSRGDFAYLDDRGTRTNTADDRTIRRQNNDFQSYDFTGSLSNAKTEGLQWRIYENFWNKRQGIPGLGTSTSARARLNELHNLLNLSFSPANQRLVRPLADESESKNGGPHWKTDLFFDYQNSRFQDPQSEIGLGTQDNDDDTFRFGPKLELKIPLAINQWLSGFVAHRGEIFQPTNHASGTSTGPLSQRHMIAIGLEDEITLWNEKIVIDPSLRLQIFVNDLSGQDPSFAQQTPNNTVTDRQLSAKLGLQYRPLASLRFKTNFYRGFRQPTFGELFGDRGALVGNPALNPEESLNFDIGADAQTGMIGFLNQISASAVYFLHTTDQLIQFLQTSQFTAKAQNLGRSRTQGGEFSLRWQAWQNFSGSANYIYQSAKDIGPNSPTHGKKLPGRPQHQLFAELGLKFHRVRPFLEASYLSNNFLDSQNLLRVNYRTLLASGLTVTPQNNIKISATAKNLLNSRVSDVVGFPLPGRSYWGEAEWQF